MEPKELAEYLRKLALWIEDLADNPNTLLAKSKEIQAIADELESQKAKDTIESQMYRGYYGELNPLGQEW